MSKIIFVMTGVDYWTLADGTKHPTGFWAEEAVGPFEVFKEAGYDVVVATPGGVVPTVDEGSLSADANGGEENAAKVKGALDAITELRNPIALGDVNLDDYVAVFYPGGHGPMEDLAVDHTSGELLIAARDSGKPLAIVCHGPAAMLAATAEDGTNAFSGYRVAAFTNAEESQAGLADKASWLLEDRLTEAGIQVQIGDPWASNVVTDRSLVTGQNPASSRPLAAEVVARLA
ncbi:type 1 glutamine amidotransferase domain-containing protein [Gordonia liuliyuniae]|uniref:Type 1 glutamine amidotransferase domain-containing protein n=1 Tax=Gordonia liuliyuniae TaxID=2911517 RepID=A0ABS9IQF8_9ACTN|nr:type 1 glutamine amidotransferase domain-containing protein [Gordonia liuliyuniae]MCF8587792.1 type 1 glutamine amidotransferase domain-containing protein [Gordonia liuliyuniae]